MMDGKTSLKVMRPAVASARTGVVSMVKVDAGTLCDVSILPVNLMFTANLLLVLCVPYLDCKVWTRITKDTKWSRKGECWLRNFVPEGNKCTVCNSGVVAAEAVQETGKTIHC